jgi:sortase (surface protein transpeptidase)
MDGPAVFSNLGHLRPGDQVVVIRMDGTWEDFRVTDLLRVPKADFPTHSVYRSANDAELRLITCTGSFDPQTRHFEDNLIVSAVKVSADAPGLPV